MATPDSRVRRLYGRLRGAPPAEATAPPAPRPDRPDDDRLSRLLDRCRTIDVGLRAMPSGGIEAVAPAVPDCAAAGESREQALAALRGLVIRRVGEAAAAPDGWRADLRADPRFADCAWTQMVVTVDRIAPR